MRVRACASDSIAEIALVGATGDLTRVACEGTAGELTADVGVGWFYARVVTTTGEMAWSSPVFVDPG